MKLLRLFIFFIFFLFLLFIIYNQQCNKKIEYVCWEKDAKQQTYKNECRLKKDNAKYLYNWECKDNTESSLINCPESMSFNWLCTTSLLTKKWWRVDWYKWDSHNLIAYDAIVDDETKNTELFVMNPDKPDNPFCVTCAIKDIPKWFIWQPAWLPDWEHIMVQAENNNSYHIRYNHAAWWIDNDLWIVSVDWKNAYKIWESSKHNWALHPHFSADGKTLVFAERISTWIKTIKSFNGKCATPGCENPWAWWQIRVANFDQENMRITNSYSIKPSWDWFYETHEFAEYDEDILAYSYTPNWYTYVDWQYSVSIKNTWEVWTRIVDDSTDSWEEHAYVQNIKIGNSKKLEKLITYISSEVDLTWNYFNWSRADTLKTELFYNLWTEKLKQLTFMNERNDYDRFLVSDYSFNKEKNKIAFQVQPVNEWTTQISPEIWIIESSD